MVQETTLSQSTHGLLAAAIGHMRSELGAAHVLEGSDCGGHADPYSFIGAPRVVPAAVVKPGSVAEVTAIVKIANEHGTPLWTVSTGRNYGYGGASPRVSGSVVVDLSRMNSILDVNDECGTALVEPGVTFLAFADHLRAIGSNLSPSVPDIGWGSVVGNALERGFGYTGYSDHSATQCGMEVVLADGQVIRTGMGAKSNSPAWQLYKGGYGPSFDGLFFQSNFGIVTKMGLWLSPVPEQTAACMLMVQNDSDLGLVVDALRPLLLDGTIQSNVVIGNAPVIASMITPRPKWTDSAAPLGDAIMRRMMAALHLGYWNARFALYGHPEMVKVRLAIVERAIAHIPGATFEPRMYSGRVEAAAAHPADHAQLGIPGIENVRMGEWRSGIAAHTDISLICPPTGRDALKFTGMIRRAVEAHGFDYTGGFTLFPRHAVALGVVSFDKSSEEDRRAVQELFPAVIAEASVEGAAPYRSHLAFMDLIAAEYDTNEHALLKLAGRFKGMLDPNGILAQGKQGIWSKQVSV